MPSVIEHVQTHQVQLQAEHAQFTLELHATKHQRQVVVSSAPSQERDAAMIDIDQVLAELNLAIIIRQGQLREAESDLLRAQNRVQNQRNRLHEHTLRAAEQQRLVVHAEQAVAQQQQQLAQTQQEIGAGRDALAILLDVAVADLDATLAALDTAAQGETMYLMPPAIEPVQRAYPLPAHSSYNTPQGDRHFDATGRRVGPQGEPLV